MKSNCVVRWARVKDMPRVLELIIELAIYENAEKEVFNTVEGLIKDGFGVQPSFESFVAELNNEIVGFAIFYTSYSTWKGNCIYLEDLLVTESKRRLGIGEKLFNRVLDEAKLRGVKRFEWQVLDWNEPAINFYKKYNADLDPSWINGKLLL